MLQSTILHLPVIFAPFNKELLVMNSLILKLRSFPPVLKKDASNLEACLKTAKVHYPTDKLKELSVKINSYPGEAVNRIRKEIFSLIE